MDGWLGFYGMISLQIAAILCWSSLKFISTANGMYYSFRMNVMEKKSSFEFRSCIEILVNDIKIYTVEAAIKSYAFWNGKQPNYVANNTLPEPWQTWQHRE